MQNEILNRLRRKQSFSQFVNPKSIILACALDEPWISYDFTSVALKDDSIANRITCMALHGVSSPGYS
jgi:hypothetical protein